MNSALMTMWIKRHAAIPNWAALSLAGSYLGIILALGAAAVWTHRQEVGKVHRQGFSREVVWLARAVELASRDKGFEAAVPEFRRVRYEPGIQRCEVVDRSGLVLAGTDSVRVGKPIAEALADALMGVSENEVTTFSDSSTTRSVTYAIRLRRSPEAATQAASAPAGNAENGIPKTLAWLLVDTLDTREDWLAANWWTLVACVALAAMGMFWLVYRIVSRSLRPMVAIRQRLLAPPEQLAEQFALLRVNDSLDQTASAWNRLIEFASELQQEVQSARLRSAVGSALDTYRSEQLAAVLRNMPHGVLVVEDTGQVTFANPSAVRMLNRQDEDLTGKMIDEFLPETVRTEVMAGARGPSRWVDHTLDGSDGATSLRFITVPLSKDAQNGAHVVFMQDISQSKEMERAQDAFLYHVTHELRTPLTNIRAYTETLAGGVLDDPESLRECYNVISGETERLSRLVEAILNVSQLEVGTARLSMGEVYVDRMIRDAVQDMQAHATTKGIDLRLRLPPKLPVIRGDKDRLAVVMANIVGNAIKYTPAGGQVEIACTTEPDTQSNREPTSLRISVSDTGIGIDPAHHEKIFEKFYRVRDEKVESEPGTGLGLAIAKETVRLHGGSIVVESTPGRGSTFHVTLPVRSK